MDYLNLSTILDDFERNGVSSDLDEMDILMVKMRGTASHITIDFCEEEKLAKRNAEARQRVTRIKKRNSDMSCVFCKKNKEDKKVYKTHNCKDDKGSVTCPILQNYKCPVCGATGNTAHTIKYCPMKYANEHGPLVVKRSHKFNSMLRGLSPTKWRN